jgi:hypothetical protein
VRYLQVKVHHWYQRHQRQICHRYQPHWWQICPPFSLALLIPVENLPPASLTPAANLPLVLLTPVGTISGCRHLKLHLKAKIYIYVNSTTQRCPNKIMKIFQLEDFCHLPLVSTTPLANLELQISLRIFAKNLNRPYWYNH